MALDLTKPVQGDGGETVEILCTDVPGDYPIAALIHDQDGNVVADSFNLDGNSANGPVGLVNAPDSTIEAKDGDILLPVPLRVVTAKKGPGVVVKVRQHDTKTMFIKPDNGETPFWALNRNVSAA